MLSPVNRKTENELVEKIERERLEEHLDAFEGLNRVSGTEDEWTASEYIVDTLQSYGVNAELREFDGYISTPQEAYVQVTVPESRTISDAITVSFSGVTPQSGVHEDIVYLEEISNDTVTANRVAGKIVFTRGLPTPAPVVLLEEADAAGVVFESVSADHLHEMIVTPVWGTPGLDDVESIPEIPVVEVASDVGTWLREQCATGPVEATIHTEVSVEVTKLPCAIGRIEGAESERYMVVGNHVDSWYEGITDNATAMAATIELARVFSERRPERGLVFGFWPAHSTGRYAGSTWFADKEWVDLRENGVAYLHLDLCGLRGAESLWHQEMSELSDELLDVMETVSELPVTQGGDSWLGGDRPARNGDQSFWGTGLSSVLVGARLDPTTEEGGPIGGGWWWHTPEDTRDKVDIDVLLEETKLSVALVSRICCSPVLPHDYRRTVDEFQERVSETADVMSADVAELEADLESLADALSRAYSVLDSVESVDSELGRAAEDVQVRLGNELIPGLYMRRSDYEQEPALPHDLLPGLQAMVENQDATLRMQLFAETDQQREVTRLRHRVRRARRSTLRFIDDHDEGE